MASVTTAIPSAGGAEGMRPKEHGAYAILGVPLITAWIVGGATWVGGAIALAAVAGFLANEPLLVVWGHRGRRAQAGQPAALRSLVLRLMVVLAAGAAAWYGASIEVRRALIACALTAGIGFVVSMLGGQRTLGGQMLAVVGLTLPSFAVLLAGGLALESSSAITMAWMTGLMAGMAAVRGVIAAQKKSASTTGRLANDATLAVMGIVVIAAIALGYRGFVPLAPLTLAAIGVRVVCPAARHLRRVGWVLVGANLLSAILLIICTAGR